MFEQKAVPQQNQVYNEFVFECIGNDLYESDLTDDEVHQFLAIEDAGTFISAIEQSPQCPKEIATVPAADIHGSGTEVPIGSGVTPQVTVAPAQLRDAALSDNGAFFSLLDASGESMAGSAGLFGTLDYPSLLSTSTMSRPARRQRSPRSSRCAPPTSVRPPPRSI